MTTSARAIAMLLAGFGLTAASSQAQSVSGAFTMSGKSLKPAHVAAFRIRNQNAPGELLADDHVVLEVEGEPFANSKMLYLVEMRLVEGRWRYDDSSTIGMLR